MSATATVLDASAVLAIVLDEDGGALVSAKLPGALISAANWAEVIERTIGSNADAAALRPAFEALGVSIVPVNVGQAEAAAHLRGPTRPLGLSLADRLCFALAVELRAPVLTADRKWSEVEVGVEVRVIR
ncbi:MAG: type II toxin-antitoxin system VapC family toxin [Solirubrobacterales bacterium]